MDTPMKLLVDIATGVEQMVPLTAEEIAQRETDQDAAAEVARADAKVAADREALVAKLASGKASAAETQQALAQLLGHG